MRSEIEYHYGKRMRHTVRLGYFGLLRNANKVLKSEIEFGDNVFPIGTEVNSKFNLQIFKADYGYSFFSDERIRLGGTLGLFIMPITFSTTALDLSGEAAEFVAPLPVIGLGFNFAIAPKLYLKQSIEVLYLEIANFKGSLSDINIRLEYDIIKHLGLGIGYNSYRLNLMAQQEGSMFFDFEGTVKTSYSGLLFYAKYSF